MASNSLQQVGNFSTAKALAHKQWLIARVVTGQLNFHFFKRTKQCKTKAKSQRC
jgi:hypothetical protein